MTPRATLIEAMQDATDPTDALDRMLATMTALGLKVVPVEATVGTRAMTGAGADRLPAVEGIYGLAGKAAGNVYRAMIAAAPDVLGAGE